jgi:putative ABC transport system permease protein
MTAVVLSPWDLALAGSLVLLDAALSVVLRLQLHRQIVWASLRMIVQLVAVGYLLRFVFGLNQPAATLAIVMVMALIAAREIATRPKQRFIGHAGYMLTGVSVVLATFVTAALALATAIRPTPWYDPHYAIPLAGIILGAVLNSGSITLDNLLGGLKRERMTIEAQLGLGYSFAAATTPLLRDSIRRGLLPIVNQMSAAGIITLPGIMTGQIIAGMDPVEAVKYQILLMFLLAGSSGIAALSIAFLALRRLTDDRQRLRLGRLRT